MVDQNLILEKERLLTSLKTLTLADVDRLLANYRAKLKALEAGSNYSISEQPTEPMMIYSDMIRALERARAQLTTRPVGGRNNPVPQASKYTPWIILGVGLLAGYILFKK